MLLPFFVGFCVCSLFCYTLLCVLSSIAINPLGKRGLVALDLSAGCDLFPGIYAVTFTYEVRSWVSLWNLKLLEGQ